MASDILPCTLTLPSDLRLLPLARNFIETLCQAGGLDRAITNAIVLASDEAVNNAIRHAHRDNPSALIRLEFRMFCDAVEIRLTDEGEPFDLAAVPHLDPGEIRIGGRGVYLMRTLMDELTCQSHGQRGNTLRMVKHCRRD
jgi:serine/threonine-protein kinase RsbW